MQPWNDITRLDNHLFYDIWPVLVSRVRHASGGSLGYDNCYVIQRPDLLYNKGREINISVKMPFIYITIINNIQRSLNTI